MKRTKIKKIHHPAEHKFKQFTYIKYNNKKTREKNYQTLKDASVLFGDDPNIIKYPKRFEKGYKTISYDVPASDELISTTRTFSYFTIILVIFFMLAFSSLVMETNKSNYDTCISIADCVSEYGKDFKNAIANFKSYGDSYNQAVHDFDYYTNLVENNNDNWDNFTFSDRWTLLWSKIEACFKFNDKSLNENWKDIYNSKVEYSNDDFGEVLINFIKFLFMFLYAFLKFIFNVIGLIF